MNNNFKDDEPQANDQEMSFEDMLEESFAPQKRISVGDKVKARVVRIGQEYIFLDLGTRTEGLLRQEEYRESKVDEELQVGQGLVVYVTAIQGETILCGLRLSADSTVDKGDGKEAVLGSLQEAQAARMPVEGSVKEVVKGGFSVTVMGLRAFCPISQISNVYCEVPEEHLGKTYDFEIIKLEEGGRNIVVSRRVILEREEEQRARELWGKLELGGVYEGIVTSIHPYGAFVNIGGLEGLLHISEISHDRVDDVESVLEKGQKVRVSIKDIDLEKKRISLSLKALSQDPWETALSLLQPNQIVKGQVVRIASFGVFVQVLPGIDGLVHVSELSKDRRVNNPRELVTEGQEVVVKILKIDPESKRVSLSMQTEEDDTDWQEELGKSRKSSSGHMGTLGDLLRGQVKKK